MLSHLVEVLVDVGRLLQFVAYYIVTIDPFKPLFPGDVDAEAVHQVPSSSFAWK